MLLDQLVEQEALTCKTERLEVSKWNHNSPVNNVCTNIL